MYESSEIICYDMIECICQKTKILQNKILTTDSNVLSKIFHVRHKSIIKQVDYLNIIHYFCRAVVRILQNWTK